MNKLLCIVFFFFSYHFHLVLIKYILLFWDLGLGKTFTGNRHNFVEEREAGIQVSTTFTPEIN